MYKITLLEPKPQHLSELPSGVFFVCHPSNDSCILMLLNYSQSLCEKLGITTKKFDELFLICNVETGDIECLEKAKEASMQVYPIEPTAESLVYKLVLK